MIKELSGRTHEVITGGYMVSKDYEKSFSTSCLGSFLDIPFDEIIKYSNTSEPYDKAGGYAIQGFIGRFINKVDGDFFSVIGMPKSTVYKLLSDYIRKQ